MKLYIANTTKHFQEIMYRIPEFTKVFSQTIGPGKQQQIYQDSDRDTLEGILAQHTDTPKPFVVSEDEAARHRGFIGLIYSFDKPVKESRIEDTFAKNDEALQEMGAENRKNAAAALSETMDEKAGESGSRVNSLEMSVEEETRRGEPESDKKLNEVIQVEKTGKGKGGKGSKGKK